MDEANDVQSAASSVDTDEDCRATEDDVRLFLVGSLGTDETALAAARSFGVPVEAIESGEELLNTPESGTSIVLVVEDCSGPYAEVSHRKHIRILGRTALLEMARSGQGLQESGRPLFSHAMSGLIICFTGFRKKDQLMRLVKLVQNMGGSIRKEMSSRVTHLVAHSCGGEKYQYAMTFRVPIMSEEWITSAWANRKTVGFSATSHEFMAPLKLKPFFGARICFVGFADTERKHMEEILADNGGTVAEMSDCTHMVVESYETSKLTQNKTPADGSTPSRLQRKSEPVPHPVPLPRKRRSSFLSLLLSPTKYSSIREEEEPVTPQKVMEAPLLNHIQESSSMVVDGEQHPAASILMAVEEPGEVRAAHSTPTATSTAAESPLTLTPVPAQPVDEATHAGSQSNTPILDDLQICVVPQNTNPDAFVVRAEWFWVSVQNEGCAVEEEYRVEEQTGSANANVSRDSISTPTCSRMRKRKRLRDAGSLILPDTRAVPKRRSSVSDAGLLNMSGSFLDGSTAAEKPPSDEVESANLKTLSPRHLVFLELVQTETNYVGILNTIMTLIKAPLEKMEEEPLLDNTELKTIFGHLPPIYHLHSRMLQELCRANTHWTEATCTGNIILKYATEMVKAYPPFVNFFEQTKEMLAKCDQTKPRFHAFLKVCQSKPECGRQTLGELLIRPVQRLPSISLLLGDILKHTSKSNPDHSALESALSAIREVMTHINEDKRRMDACMDMFSIFNDIDNCPPHLVSSHRAFVSRCDVMELSNELSGRGDGLVFFLFSDILEVCKKRSKGGTSLKSPNTAAFRSTKHFKHVRLIPLSDIKRVFDVQDSHGECEEAANMFALKCRSNQELKEKLYSFALVDEDVDKLTFLHTLCRQLANTVCKADAAYFFATMEYHEIGINVNDAGFGSLSKAFRLASRTKLLKLGRTFSFNKTPSKLKRAVSTMMSPFGSSTNLTPASQLSQMRLASCTNLKGGSRGALKRKSPRVMRLLIRSPFKSQSPFKSRRLRVRTTPRFGPPVLPEPIDTTPTRIVSSFGFRRSLRFGNPEGSLIGTTSTKKHQVCIPEHSVVPSLMTATLLGPPPSLASLAKAALDSN